MPIKVRYDVRCNRLKAPLLSSCDRHYARIEMTNLQQHAIKGDIFYITKELIAVEPMSKPEQYLMLVSETRHMQRYYFDNRSRSTKDENQANLKAALAKEKALDDWNMHTRAYIDAHTGFQQVLAALPPESERARHFAFFQVVEAWRKAWKEYFAYKKRSDRLAAVEAQMKQKCFDFEKAIDDYLNKALETCV